MSSSDHLDRRTILAGLATGLAATRSHNAWAQESSFLKGQTVRFIVGYSPGGGYDALARMLAPHFEKATGATVVVENRPGAGGATALNQLTRGKTDGLSMQMLNGEAALIAQLTKQPGVAYDMTKVSIYARVAHEQHMMVVRPGLPDTLKEILASGQLIKFSAGNRIDNLGDYAAVLCEALRMNCRIVTGYPGSKEAALAVMNGEVDALTISEGSAIDFSQGGRTKIVATIGKSRSELRKDLPTVYEMFDIPPERKWILDFRLAAKEFGRAVVGPPGLPAERLQYLQQVWKNILTDPEVMAEGARTERPLSYETPARLAEIARDLLESLPPEKLKEMNEVIFKKFT